MEGWMKGERRRKGEDDGFAKWSKEEEKRRERERMDEWMDG